MRRKPRISDSVICLNADGQPNAAIVIDLLGDHDAPDSDLAVHVSQFPPSTRMALWIDPQWGVAYGTKARHWCWPEDLATDPTEDPANEDAP